MPKHFPHDQKAQDRPRHLAKREDGPKEDAPATEQEEPKGNPEQPAEPSQAEPSQHVVDLGETRPMSPAELGLAQNQADVSEARTTLLAAVPSPEDPAATPAEDSATPDSTSGAGFTEAASADEGTTTSLADQRLQEQTRLIYPDDAQGTPHATPKSGPEQPPHEPAESSPETAQDEPPTLGRHEVAAVQANDDLYMRSEPSPYLSRRQAAQDPQKARHRHTVLIVIVLVLVGLAAVGGGAYYIYNAMRPTVQTPSVQFETDKITRGDFYDTIDATAALEPVDSADVVPQVTGTITNLSVEDGSSVSKGDVLFTLDNPTVKAATSTAKDQLDDAQSDLDDKNDQVTEAQDKLDEVRKTLSDSLSKIYSLVGSTPAATTFNVDTDGDGTPDALDVDGDGKADGYDTNDDGIVDMVDTNGDGTPDAFDTNGDGKADSATDLPSTLTAEQKTQLTSAETAYQTARSELKTAQSNVDAANAAAKTAQDNVSTLQDAYDRALAQEKKLTVTAPISGVVHNLSSSLVEGGSISTTTKLCEVDDVSQYLLTIQASETKARKAKVGQTVNLTFPDIPDLTATGTVQNVATTRTEGTDTFAITVVLDQPDGQLSVGTNADVSVVLQEIDDVLMVPSKAITTSGRNSYLDVLLDPVRGIDTQVQVNVVADNGDTAVVEADNIQEGNAVVLGKSTE